MLLYSITYQTIQKKIKVDIINLFRARSADLLEKGVNWIARTPPKRQVEGSNPSGPVTIKVLLIGFY
jgi:hypothetical protein